MSEITFQELAAYQATPDATGKTLAEQIAAAQEIKAALDAAQAPETVGIDWAAHKANLKAEQAEFAALGNAERVAKYDDLIAECDAELAKQ